MWFQDLTGLTRDDPVAVRGAVSVEGDWLTSAANGRRMRAGRLTLPSLAELRALPVETSGRGESQLREVVGDVRALHADPAHAGAVFQVASQFNLLEMPGPDVGPEDGIAGYAYDRTQGPACAMACGACRVAFKSDTRRVDGQFLPLNVIFGWLWGEAFTFSPGNLIDRSKQTGFLLERTKQSNPRMSVKVGTEHRRFAQRT